MQIYNTTMFSFVYFDVGGVVIRDFSGTIKWQELQKDIGITEENAAIFSALWKKYHDRLSIDLDIDSLLPIIRKECCLDLPETYSMLQDFVDRFEKNPSIWPVLEQARRTYKTGLLTNMYPRMLDAIKARSILPPVAWDIVIDSSMVGCKKPDTKIFNLATEQANVKKEEILFVDNTEEIIRGAEDFGWQTFLYDSSDPVGSSRMLSALF